MSKSIRKVIKIDEELCNGCGQCVPSCAEGAIQIIDGKARLVADKYCDGLGACMGECPMGALSFEEREAEAFDEHAVEVRLTEIGRSDADSKAKHLSSHSHTGCPGSRMIDFGKTDNAATDNTPRLQSELKHWPIKLNLMNPSAPYLKNADLVLAADCSAFAYASFHPDYLKGHVLVIGCPKFDNVQHYVERLAAIIREAEVRSITVVHMEVPCCSGLVWAAQSAIQNSGRDVPFKDITLSLDGNEKS